MLKLRKNEIKFKPNYVSFINGKKERIKTIYKTKIFIKQRKKKEN